MRLPPTSVTAAKSPAGTIDERYLSFCVDLGMIAQPTRFWNPDGSGETVGERPPFDFSRPRLRRLCGALSPAYLRVGGTEADRVYYALEQRGPQPPPPAPAGYGTVVTGRQLIAMGEFAREAGLEISLTLNAGWGSRAGSAPRPDGSAGAWRPDQAVELMRFALHPPALLLLSYSTTRFDTLGLPRSTPSRSRSTS